jgi:hypothetical protein
MFALGQSRHFDRAPLTSGLPRLADILRVIRHVSNVPIGDNVLFHDQDRTVRELYNSIRSAPNQPVVER